MFFKPPDYNCNLARAITVLHTTGLNQCCAQGVKLRGMCAGCVSVLCALKNLLRDGVCLQEEDKCVGQITTPFLNKNRYGPLSHPHATRKSQGCVRHISCVSSRQRICLTAVTAAQGTSCGWVTPVYISSSATLRRGCGNNRTEQQTRPCCAHYTVRSVVHGPSDEGTTQRRVVRRSLHQTF